MRSRRHARACSCCSRASRRARSRSTGVEAISNGVPAFRRPESKNAATTLVWMATILGTLFLGVSMLAHHLQPVSEPRGHRVRADGQAGVRRQLRVLGPAARDRRHPHARGEHRVRRLPAAVVDHRPRRLPARASSRTAATGSCSPTACSCSRVAAALLIVAFGGKTNALIPLYAVGVFLSFTLSQAGMVRHHQKEREPQLEAQAS